MTFKIGDKIGLNEYTAACQFVNMHNETDAADKLIIATVSDRQWEIREMDDAAKKALVQEKINKIKKDITDNWDWKQLKYLRGEYTDEQWSEIKAEIAARVAKINELEATIGE